MLVQLGTSESTSSNDRRREHDTEAHRLARLNCVRRQQEQKRDTAARRQVRVENPQRRSDEQVYFPGHALDTLNAV